MSASARPGPSAKPAAVEYRTLDPSTGKLVERYPLHTDAEVESTLRRAVEASAAWRSEPLAQRSALLGRVASALEARAEELGALMALEMGKPVAQGSGEAAKCAWVCRYYAENGARFLASEERDSDGSEARVRYDPLGTILAIMPWNFPFWQVFRFAAPGLAAGNVVLLKHAPSTPRCALTIESLFRDAGAPPGVFQSLFLSNEEAARVIAHPVVRGVTLTGSTGAGRAVAATAGRHLKPIVLELGGSDPFIVFDDADLEEAVRTGVASRCLNSGQSCIAAKRFLVEDGIHDAFCDAFVAAMEAQRVGDPRDPGTNVGPLAREDLRHGLASQVERVVAAGGTILCGGVVPAGPGFFYPPTVVAGLPADAPVGREEMFGPVASIFRFSDEAGAVALANATDYGLGASVWTADRERVERMIGALETGSVFVNGMVKSDPRLPFGGVKDSGFGRELGREGMLEFVNRKTVWIR